jgi:hypothetical protein
MHVQQALAGILVIVSVIILAAIGQDERYPEQESAQAQVTNCQTARLRARLMFGDGSLV